VALANHGIARQAKVKQGRQHEEQRRRLKFGRSMKLPAGGDFVMPTRKALERAERDKHAGKAPSTQAGEFIREEIHHIREGEHGARSPEQAIAIGLSEARRVGIDVKPPARAKTSESTRRKAARDYARGHGKATARRTDSRRSAASKRALGREPRESASAPALALQAHAAAARRSRAERSAAARRAARTKGPAKRSAAASKAARTRAAQRRV
jgi:hypothetical protein